MGPKQIAGVMSQVRRAQAERKGEEFDEEEDAKIVAMVEEAQEKGSLALAATSAVSRRRHHRSSRYAHGTGTLPVRRSQSPRRRRDRLRGLSTVSFSTVLIANRGEIARRIIRAARDEGSDHGGRLRRGRRQRAFCRGRRSLPTPGDFLSRRGGRSRRGPARRCRSDPSRIRLSLRERELRRVGGSSGARVDWATLTRHRLHGRQTRGQEVGPGGGSTRSSFER